MAYTDSRKEIRESQMQWINSALKTATLCKWLPISMFLAACAPVTDAPVRNDRLTNETVPAPGVALALAEQRVQFVSDVRYALYLDLPASPDEMIGGNVTVRFNLLSASAALVLDFKAPADHVLGVTLNGATAEYSVPQDHIVIAAEHLSSGEQTVAVSFLSTDAALNRQSDFLYALFVPDRASTAFPVFEQPDIKARYSLTLDVPEAWTTLSNGTEVSRTILNDTRHRVEFAQTELISSYLFAFAAGMLDVETAMRDGRHMNLYHRETDPDRLSQNLDAIFDLHATALSWLEEYTGIPYPFGKFDFFAIPAFQFGGMEHPGAIWYRAETLFLDPSASRTQELGRASLIAHETAHMWFGDLVTMKWFDDVWMKEVFANFLAAKIAGPAFPDLNLALRFFQAHHPSAYGVDRTEGANPIRQPLDNLRDAGSLYGAIIYQKAPIVMQQLETLLGEAVLREGLGRYLERYSFDNATWMDLIEILDELTDDDLGQWSQVWVNESGRPRIDTEVVPDGVMVRQRDDNTARNLLWTQPVVLLVGHDSRSTEHSVLLDSAQALVAATHTEAPDFVLAGADGVGYARFELDEASREYLLEGIQSLENPLHRAVAWQALWEEVLESRVTATRFVDALLVSVAIESDELLSQQLLGLLRGAFWRYLSSQERIQRAPMLETTLWQALEQAPTAGRKGAYFNALIDLSLSEDGITHLYDIWRGEVSVAGLPLQEQQFIALAEALALREVPTWQQILDEQETRISNPDRLARFRFVRPALSAHVPEREARFRSFAELANRRQESWVLDAQRFNHHPLRAPASLEMVADSLQLVQPIQQSGDIFFPLRWLNATLDGHSSAEAAMLVHNYLADNPDLPDHLRAKVLQAADGLFRSAGAEYH